MSESKVIDVKTLDDANYIRSKLLEEFPKLWIIITQNKDLEYDVSVANEWLGVLPDQFLNNIREKCIDLKCNNVYQVLDEEIIYEEQNETIA